MGLSNKNKMQRMDVQDDVCAFINAGASYRWPTYRGGGVEKMGQYICKCCGKVLDTFEAEKVVVYYVEPQERCCSACEEDE